MMIHRLPQGYSVHVFPWRGQACSWKLYSMWLWLQCLSGECPCLTCFIKCGSIACSTRCCSGECACWHVLPNVGAWRRHRGDVQQHVNKQVHSPLACWHVLPNVGAWGMESVQQDALSWCGVLNSYVVGTLEVWAQEALELFQTNATGLCCLWTWLFVGVSKFCSLVAALEKVRHAHEQII
jgi:hypothetical protein